MALIDQKHPFFQPLWRRIALVGVVAVWLGFEVLYTRDTLWISVATIMLIYGIWSFFLNWPKQS
ncbi:MAG: DUF3329 domain-containing protein [Rhizobiales bacterium]|nr:DUF3329 domain-containing protein [Hyphomicrobiales bacterium]